MTPDARSAADAALYRLWDRVAALRLTGTWKDRKRQVLDLIAKERAALTPSEPRLNEYGRAACVCGVSVLPENWANHLQSQQRGPHAAPSKP